MMRAAVSVYFTLPLSNRQRSVSLALRVPGRRQESGSLVHVFLEVSCDLLDAREACPAASVDHCVGQMATEGC